MVKVTGGEIYIVLLTIELLLGPAECFDGSDVELIGMFEVVDEELGHRFGVRLGEVVERNMSGWILFALLHQQYQLVSGRFSSTVLIDRSGPNESADDGNLPFHKELHRVVPDLSACQQCRLAACGDDIVLGALDGCDRCDVYLLAVRRDRERMADTGSVQHRCTPARS